MSGASPAWRITQPPNTTVGESTGHLLLLLPFNFMLRRTPSTSDGKPVDRLQESTRINKPFKPPSVSKKNLRDQPQRKRKRVSYKGADAGNNSDSDSDTGSKKKKKNGRDGFEMVCDDNTQSWPVFRAKPFDSHARQAFSIPEMKNKNGEVVPTVATNLALGIRPPSTIPPRPLHDPMEDHAIVLYDPTIDDRETDEERKEREKEEAKRKAEEEARAKTAGMFNPHKPLRDLLGGGKEKQKRNDKVPVVIDPRLSKVLRPHQVEGVKVRDQVLELWRRSHSVSSYTSAPLGWLWTINMAVLWLTRWVLGRRCSASLFSGHSSSSHHTPANPQ
jgi:DNA repair and recombination protein RAD54 and RAD54-like protein